MQKRFYRLKVSGTVAFGDEDEQIEDCLLGKVDTEAMRLEIAYQELEESATELAVEMERI